MLFSTRNKLTLPSADDALPGRDTAMPVPDAHEVLGTPLTPPFPEGIEVAYFALGCFWGAERAELSRRRYNDALARAGKGEITTEIAEAGPFYYAEDYHQQYLAPTKNPNGYCGLGGTGVSCPVGLTA